MNSLAGTLSANVINQIYSHLYWVHLRESSVLQETSKTLWWMNILIVILVFLFRLSYIHLYLNCDNAGWQYLLCIKERRYYPRKYCQAFLKIQMLQYYKNSKKKFQYLSILIDKKSDIILQFDMIQKVHLVIEKICLAWNILNRLSGCPTASLAATWLPLQLPLRLTLCLPDSLPTWLSACLTL